jgi:hypothetical protein
VTVAVDDFPTHLSAAQRSVLESAVESVPVDFGGGSTATKPLVGGDLARDPIRRPAFSFGRTTREPVAS